MFTTPDSRALFVRRTENGDHQGEWAFPGGMLHDDETPEHAARREAVEEVGTLPRWELKLLDRSPGDAPVDYTTFKQHVEEFEPRLNGEHDAFTWAPLHHPPSPLHPGVDRILRAGYMTEGRAAQDSTWNVAVDYDHDGPWMSCMSLDGRVMYQNCTLPLLANIDGKAVTVAEVLKRHEVPEWLDLENLIKEFKAAEGREPEVKERVALYTKAHKRSGVPNEREYCERSGIPWGPWNAWCRGEESRIEKGPFTNMPADADVKPIPHTHGELAATDSALRLAFDRESVRTMDPNGRLRVAVANISKANVCPYHGVEIPEFEKLGLDPEKTYALLRDPEELAKAAPSFNGVQILRKHTPVSAEDHQPWEVVGATGSECRFNDPYLQNSLSIWSQEAIDGIESEEKRELSCGYHYRADMTPGIFGGIPYDGVMRDIVGNHVALVEDGRAGPDVIVGDSSMDNKDLAKKLDAISARQVTVGALVAYLKPRLAKGAKLALDEVLDGIKAGPDFKNSKTKIIERLASRAKGKVLAKDGKAAGDMNVEELATLVDVLGAHEMDSVDESVSGPQHRAMEAAAHGHSTIGIPQSVGQEFHEADKGKTFHDEFPHAAQFLQNKLSKDDFEEFLKQHGRGKGEGKDQHVVGGEGKAALEKEEHPKKTDVEQMDGKDTHMAGDTVTKQAMDAAIKAASSETAKRVREEVRASERAIRKAEDFVRPWIGQLSADLAFDSADDVYRHAAIALNVEGAKDIHASALPAIIKMCRKPGEREQATGGHGQSSPLALDSAGTDELAKMFPGIERIGL
jgi:8-oxo-dGTP pyrophosphatase MutT (NUDIX family)